MERTCLAWPVKNLSIVLPMDNWPSRKGFPSWESLSLSLQLCSLPLASHMPHQPPTISPDILHGLCVVWQWQHHLHRHLLVMLGSGCPLHLPSITPYLTHTLWILLLLFDSDQTTTKVAGYWQETSERSLSSIPTYSSSCQVLFSFPHTVSHSITDFVC